MKRRDFMAIVVGLAALFAAAQAQQRPTKIARVGIIDDGPIWEHFRRGLHELGHIEGRDITFEYRVAEGQPDRLATAASAPSFPWISSRSAAVRQLEPLK